MLPAIGSMTAAGGRLGVVVDARPPAEPADGRQLAALQLRTVDQRDAQGQAAARVSALAPLPAEATERPGASRRILASRDERAAPAVARRPEQRSEPASDLAGPTADPSLRAIDGPSYAAGDSFDIIAGNNAAGLQGFGVHLATVTVPTDPPPWDSAMARLGHRLYAAARSDQAEETQVQAGSTDPDPTQVRQTRGGRLDLTL